jgi:hypothetical protein
VKRVIALLLVLGITFIIAIPVSAAPPVVEAWSEVVDHPVPEVVCPGIEVWNNEEIDWRLMGWYDSEGDLVMMEGRISGTDNFYNPANPHVVLSGKFSINYHYDVRTGKDYVTGIPWHITVPGYGAVLIRSGRWFKYPEFHLAGKDSFANPTDLAQFCSCLAGD